MTARMARTASLAALLALAALLSLAAAETALAQAAPSTRACALLGCKTCIYKQGGAVNATVATCTKCLPTFQLAKGACGCRNNWGAWLEAPAPPTAAPAGWPAAAPNTDRCRANSTAAGCTCRACPRGYRSQGGALKAAMCYSPQTQRLAFTLAVQCPPGNATVAAGDPSGPIKLALAGVRPVIERMLGEAAQATSEVAGAVRATAAPRPFVVDGAAGAGAAYWVSVAFTGSRRARDALINAINDVDASNPCAGWAARTARAGARYDVCAALAADPVLSACAIRELRAVASNATAPPPALVGQPLKIDITSFSSPLQWASRIFSGLGKYTDQSNKLQKKETMWEGKFLAFVDTPIMAVTIGLAIANIFMPKEDKYMPYLKEINETTHKILDEVYVVQAQLVEVQTTLQRMEVMLQNIRCDLYSLDADKTVRTIKNLYWQGYVDPDLGALVMAQETLAEAAQKGTYMRLGSDPRAALKKWVDGVLDGKSGAEPVQTLLYTLNDALVGTGGTSGMGFISSCAKAKYDEWLQSVKELPSFTLPIDDSQYYDKVSNALDYFIFWQLNGLRVYQEATLWRAADAALAAAAQANITLSPTQTNPQYFCLLAKNATIGTPLAAARPFCNSYSTVTKTVYNNIAAQLELLGAPFSAGDAPGEGVRLVLGSDITGVKGSDNGAKLDIPTRWLMPASMAAFDARCNKSDMDAAMADGCVLLGLHSANCTTGCGGDPQQEAAWARFSVTGSAEYPLRMWQLASNATWAEIRAMMTAFIPDNATGDANDLLAQMDAGRLTAGVTPMANMSDRPFWIPGASVYDVSWKDAYVGVPIGADIWGQKYYAKDNLWARVQCFAAYGLDPKNNDEVSSTNAGGVACSKADFKGAFGKFYKLWGGWGDWASPTYFTTMNERMLARHPKAFYPGHNQTRPCVPPLYKGPNTTGEWCTDSAYSDHSCMPKNSLCYTMTTWYDNNYRISKPSWMHNDTTNTFPSCGNAAPGWFAEQWHCFAGPQFPWFVGPKLQKDDAGTIEENPLASKLRLFRLPVLDITSLNCSASPFTDAPLRGPRANQTAWGGALTRCGDDKTRAITRRIGSGGYESTRGANSTAALRLVPDINVDFFVKGDRLFFPGTSPVNVACDIKWIDERGVDRTNDPRYIRTKHVYISVREGPLNDQELAAEHGWQSVTTDVGPLSDTPFANVSARDALNVSASRVGRMLGCVVVGEDAETGLAVSVSAPSRLVLLWPGYDKEPALRDMGYPVPADYLPAYWRECKTDADCAGAAAGSKCKPCIAPGCKGPSICLPTYF